MVETCFLTEKEKKKDTDNSEYSWMQDIDKWIEAVCSKAIQPDNTYMMSGNRISVKTLDLNCDFPVIAAQLNAIADSFLAK